MKEKNAQLMVVVLITMVTILSIGLAFFYSQRSKIEIQSIELDRDQAQRSAQAGIDIAKLKLSDACPVWNGTTFTLGGANVTVTVTDLGSQFNVSSQATKGNAHSQSNANITKNTSAPEEWAKLYDGGGTDLWDGLEAVYQTPDGGYILGGTTNADFHLIKIDSQGNLTWSKAYTTKNVFLGNYAEHLYSFQLIYNVTTSQHTGYIMGGTQAVLSTQTLLIKADVDGTRKFKKLYSGTLQLGSLQQAKNDGGYILGGWIYQSSLYVYQVIKTDYKGKFSTGTTWKKRIGVGGFPGWDFLTSIQNTKNITTDSYDGYIVGGKIESSGYKIYVTKLDLSGEKIWARKYYDQGLSSFDHELNYLEQTSDGGYILGGGVAGNILIIKTDAQGKVGGGASGITWAKRYNIGSGEKLASVHEISGGYIMGGSTGSSNQDFFLVKIDSSGNIIWSKKYGNNTDEELKSVQQTSDGGYILGGDRIFSSSNKDFLVIKTNSSGELPCCNIDKDFSDPPLPSNTTVADGSYAPNPYNDNNVAYSTPATNTSDINIPPTTLCPQ